jgi:hypothetical protein
MWCKNTAEDVVENVVEKGNEVEKDVVIKKGVTKELL